MVQNEKPEMKLKKIKKMCVHRLHLSFLSVKSDCCEDEKVGNVTDKVEKENPLSESIPLLFKQFIKWLNMKHLKTVLK